MTLLLLNLIIENCHCVHPKGIIQLMEFQQDGEGISIKAEEDSVLLFLSGEPIEETVATYGPYVMNSQTELLEAMRDYQMGKMGFLPAN